MSATNSKTSFTVLLVLVSIAFLWLMMPYYGAILWATILAILFHPVQTLLTRRLGGRQSIAAGISVLLCICVVVVPASIFVGALAQQATEAYNAISTHAFDLNAVAARIRDALPQRVTDYLSTVDMPSLDTFQSQLTSFLEKATQTIARHAYSVGQGTAQFAIATGVALYLLFFLFRDGNALAAKIRRASPLSDHHTDRLLKAFVAVMKATVKGSITIAIVQGTIGGVTFWLLGIQAPVLWGALMCVLAMVPAVGAGLVWAPVAIYLLAMGDYTKGIILLLVGTFLISLIDNLLRPALVGKGTRMPDYLVLVSTLGGLSAIGVNGFVLGPLIAALFIAVWSLYIEDRSRAD